MTRKAAHSLPGNNTTQFSLRSTRSRGEWPVLELDTWADAAMCWDAGGRAFIKVEAPSNYQVHTDVEPGPPEVALIVEMLDLGKRKRLQGSGLGSTEAFPCEHTPLQEFRAK